MSATTAWRVPGPAKDLRVARALGRRRHGSTSVVESAVRRWRPCIGLVLLASILFTLLWRGAGGLSLDRVHHHHQAARLERRPAERHRRHADPDRARHR